MTERRVPITRKDAMQIAGMLINDGREDRYFPIGLLLIPQKIELDEEAECLVYERSLGGFNQKVVHDTEGLLEKFVGLAGARPDQILAYARRFGVLGLCEHGAPASHNPVSVWHRNPETGQLAGCRPLGRERLGAWRYYAKQALSIQSIAAALYQGNSPTSLDNIRLWGDPAELLGAAAGLGDKTFEENVHPKRLKSLSKEFVFRECESRQALPGYRQTIAALVNSWTRDGRVGPLLTWESEAPVLSFGAPDECTLFGALGMQLALLVSKRPDFVLCNGCGSRYWPTMKPKRNQRHFCPTCREAGVPQVFATKDYRDRVRSGQQPSSQKRLQPVSKHSETHFRRKKRNGKKRKKRTK